MRAREFLKESFLVEKLMSQSGSNNDWLKDKYYLLFFEGLTAGQIYAFNVTTSEKPEGSKKLVKTENKFLGIIQNPTAVIAQMKRAIKLKDFDNVFFDVEEVDDDTLEPTGEFWENVTPKEIYKDEKVTGELKPNMGNVSEAILGCAVAAKFTNQGGMITEAQVVNLAKSLARNRGQLNLQAGKDVLEFKVTIPFMDKKAFYAWLNEDSRGMTLKDYKVPADSIKMFDQRLKSAIEYANKSKKILSAVNEAVDDPGKNKIDVISDGAEKENQNTTKVDLKILIDGKETAKRLLSVKAGNVEQFGQAGGHNFNNLNEFFTSIVGIGLPETFRKKFHEIPKQAPKVWNDKKRYNFDNSFAEAYQFIAKQLSIQAKRDPDGFVENVYKGLLNHLTRNEAGVEMVILDPDNKKAFSELEFGKDFENALRQLQLVVDFRQATGYALSVYGLPKTQLASKFIPKKQGEPTRLIDLRSQYDNSTNAIRNRINMGPLLKHIADIENYLEQTPQEPQQQKTAPAVKQPLRKPTAAPVPVAQNPAAVAPAPVQPIRAVPALKASQQKLGSPI
jgi:hypothetical protein